MTGETLPKGLTPSVFRPRLWAFGPVEVWVAAAVMLLAYAAYFALLPSYPFQDYPNHVARAALLGELIFHHGGHVGNLYEFLPGLALSPYVLHDALLTLCVELFGSRLGAGLFAIAVLLSLPAAVLTYVRINHLERGALGALLLSLYLTTDSFFFMAFMGFRLAVAAVVISMALLDLLRRQWSGKVFVAYSAVLVAGYLTHLTAVVFFAPVLAVTGALRLYMRSTTFRAELVLWAPVLALLALHFGVVARAHDAVNPPAYAYFWGTVRGKIEELPWDFWRFGGRPSRTMMCLFALCLLVAVRRSLSWRSWMAPPVLEQLALAAVFLGIYWVLPSQYADSSYVDLRALPMVTLFLVLACLHVSAGPAATGGWEGAGLLVSTLLLAGTNFVYLVLHVDANTAWLARYRSVVAAIPKGSDVLPVNTLGQQSSILPFLHAGSYAVLDRDATMPYLFSGDRGDPMKYFRYRRRPYMPDESWYLNHRNWEKAYVRTFIVDGRPYTWRFEYSNLDRQWFMSDLVPVDWNRVACTYAYLLVTKPYDPRYIGVGTRTVLANDAASLLKVDESGCHPEPGVAPTVRLPLEH